MGFFGFGKQHDQWMEDFSAFERNARIELARAMAEEGLTGEYRERAMALIEEAENAPEPQAQPRRKFLGLF